MVRKNWRKLFKNCNGIPIITPNEDGVPTFVIDYLCLPALHLLLGPFNKLWKELELLAPEVNQVAASLHCAREGYFGKTFEGNETIKILENTEKLKSVIDENLHIFVECMEALWHCTRSRLALDTP